MNGDGHTLFHWHKNYAADVNCNSWTIKTYRALNELEVRECRDSSVYAVVCVRVIRVLIEVNDRLIKTIAC